MPETALAESDAAQAAATSAPPRAARVLHLINGEHYSGAERVQDLLALRLPERGFAVAFACLKRGKFENLRRAQEAPLWTIAMRSRFDLRAIRRLIKLVREEQFDLLHAHTPRSVLLGKFVALRTGLPLIYHVHSPTARDSTRRLRNKLNVLAERFATGGNVHLIAVSQSLARRLRSHGYANSAITAVSNGVPAPDCQRCDRPPTEPWTLGTVALFRPRKGIEILLHALAELKDGGNPVRLRAVGGFETPEYEQEVKQLAERLGVAPLIDWLGFCDDVAGELAQMDLMVLPSLFGEGLPMVVLEAMAAGVPVVATRVEGVPEALRDGVDGLLAAPGDASDLAAAVQRIITGQVAWSSLRISALERHAAHFSDVAMATGVAEVYGRVLGQTS